MDTISLKKYIFENQKIEFVLDNIGCGFIKYHPTKDFFSCSNYNGDNQSAVNVKNNEYLNVIDWTRPNDFDENADIISLVEYNKSFDFINAIKYLHKILNISYKFEKNKKEKEKIDPLNIFEKYKCKKKSVNIEDIKFLEEDLINDYIPILHINWFREGIMPWTAKKFNLAYSYRHKRIVVPLRYWLTGDLMGVNMRTTVENYDEFGIKKYFITPTYQKNLNLFGLYENINTIKKAGYVVVFEAEKSVLKRDSLNDSTGVALSGKTISEEQVRILMGLNVEVIIALDKDVPIEEVRHICEKFNNIRNVSYIYDKWDIIGNKDSPADAPNKIYNFLFKHRIKYDKKEHEEYLKSMRKK